MYLMVANQAISSYSLASIEFSTNPKAEEAIGVAVSSTAT